MNIANNIKAVAKEHGKTISMLANEMNVLQPQISRTINNPRITLEDLSRLADAIGCNVSDFLKEEKENDRAISGSIMICPHCGERIMYTVKAEKI